MDKIVKARKYLYTTYIQPRSQEPDARRREFIINVLLSGLAILALASFTSFIIHQFSGMALHDRSSLVFVPSFLAIILFLIWLSRKGFSKVIALLLVVMVGVMASYYLWAWSFELPMTQLLYVLMIILAGVLFRARAALLASGLASLLVLIAAHGQTSGLLHPDTAWLALEPDTIDAIGCVIIFMLIGLVTWLADGEIDRSLTRARASEASLAQERDNLEIKVVERTRQLEEAQLVRVMELQRFAKIGKLTSGLLHDVASPLTTVSLSMEQLSSKRQSADVRQALQSLRHIERYFEAARKQLSVQSSRTSFGVYKEIAQVISILSRRASEEHVALVLDVPKQLKLTGDPVKFSQLVANLLINAIEAYQNMAQPPQKPTVHIAAQASPGGVLLTVRDHGKGITADDKTTIFQPFYSTKAQESFNMGIGLSLVKQFAEQDFKGRVSVHSSPTKGTVFTVRLRSQSPAGGR